MITHLPKSSIIVAILSGLGIGIFVAGRLIDIMATSSLLMLFGGAFVIALTTVVLLAARRVQLTQSVFARAGEWFLIWLSGLGLGMLFIGLLEMRYQ